MTESQIRNPCPFCGDWELSLQFDIATETKPWNEFFCMCHGCGAKGGSRPDIESAHKAWDERSPPLEETGAPTHDH
jgi:hypothetical protein